MYQNKLHSYFLNKKINVKGSMKSFHKPPLHIHVDLCDLLNHQHTDSN